VVLSLQTMAPSADSAGSVANTIPDQIRRHAASQPDHDAVVAAGLPPVSYRQLQALIDEIRAALRRVGLGRDARIAVAIQNPPHAALAIVGVTCSAVSIPMSPRLTVREIENSLLALRPDAILLAKDEESAARQVATDRGVPILEAAQTREGALPLTIAAARPVTAAAADPAGDPEPEAPAFILQTSGTASEPKLIPFSHRNMLAAAARLQRWYELTPRDRCLSVSPLFYSHGLKVTVLTPLITGGTVAFPTDPSKFDFREWFGQLRPTWYSAGPTLHRLVLDQTKSAAPAKAAHALRFVLSGGAPLPRSVQQGLQATLGVPVVEHYGSSEAAQIAANTLQPGRSRPGTCGIPWPGTLMIAGADGNSLPAGEPGEILLRGPTVISGYLDAPELNRESFVDGWFRTGDLGSLDEDGFLTLHGRQKDQINRGGEKILPAEIDEALLRHPAVAEAAAFSVPHPRLGEDIAAAVVLRPGMAASAVELRKFLHDQVAPFKVPRKIVFRDRLPKGRTGKVVRRELQQFLQQPAAETPDVLAPPIQDDARLDGALTGQLTRLWKRLLNVDRLSVDDDFFEKGGDSLLALEMLAEAEWLIGQTIPNSLLLEATTIRQLAQKLQEGGKLRSKYLIKLNSDGDRPPLFFFHGQYNTGGYYAVSLAKLLGSSQPLFVVAPHGLGEDAILNSIEAMAADRLALIMEAQPDGPYRLCGNCVGGIVAFEVARLLVAAGKKVEVIFMVDSPTVSGSRFVQLLLSAIGLVGTITGRKLERIKAWTWFHCASLQRLRNQSAKEQWAWAKRRLRQLAVRGWRTLRTVFAPRAKRAAAGPVTATAKAALRFSTLIEFSDPRTMKYSVAMSNYFPKPLAVPVVYFSVEYGCRAWQRLCSAIEVLKLPGTHLALDLPRLADALRARLKRNEQLSR
jgi:acyl-CoA synthetase (AMP-forming)/AMP-acid ligase II/thioesterase domain-containing protein